MQIKLSPTKAKNSPIKSGAKGSGGNSGGTGFVGIQSIETKPDGTGLVFSIDEFCEFDFNGTLTVKKNGVIWATLDDVTDVSPGGSSLTHTITFDGLEPFVPSDKITFSDTNNDPSSPACLWGYTDGGACVPSINEADVKNVVT